VLHAEQWGRGDPVVLIHGFTQSARSWDPIALILAQDHRVIAVDAPGHAQSAPVEADLPTGADLMAELMADLLADLTDDLPAGVGALPAWVGYSMGGRYALHVALRHPDRVRRLVLVSATGGIDDPEERAARRRADHQLAEMVEREGVAAFVGWWLQRPLFATLPAEAAAVESRLGGSAAGLAASLRLAGTGTQQPLWSELSQLEMPVLVIAGSEDDAYLAHGRRLAACIGGNATLAVVGGAGHACHLERPRAFLEIVQPFLAER
jgi:2-succinyl-6-hydroxy-2,4-cyclohexadiene-1-carboxylate synthase